MLIKIIKMINQASRDAPHDEIYSDIESSLNTSINRKLEFSELNPSSSRIA